MRIFFDTEFTGLHQKTTLISIGCISEDGRTFYAEFDDYDKEQVNSWIEENVIKKLKFSPPPPEEDNHYIASRTDDNPIGQSLYSSYNLEMRGDKEYIKKELIAWLSQFEPVEMWSDCLSYDWVLFNDLLADYSDGYPILPCYINYIPFDICTLFKLKGIDPDVSRESFSQNQDCVYVGDKHNALNDAKVIRKCYNILMKE